jgi:4-hydroxy-tetrahydrodipicolinate synthase
MGDASGSRLASGVYAALLTPRAPDSTEADAAALFEYLDKVSHAGVSGLVFFGSTGEFVHFDLAERMRVLALAVKRCRRPVLVNVSHSTFAGTIALAEQAAASGASGLLLMPPYFYRLEDDMVAEFYAQFLKSVQPALPVYLYNLPQCTTPLSPELAIRLLQTGSFAGIKSSDPEWAHFDALLNFRGQQRFTLLAGNETLYLKALSSGADGSVSGVAAALPELPVAIWRAIHSGELSVAAGLSDRLDELLIWIDKLPPLVALKQLAEVRSWLRFTPALPLDEITRNQLRDFRNWLENWLPPTLEACASVRQSSVRS